MSKRSWTKEDLILAVSLSRSIRQVISRLNLVEAGGNYEQIKKYINIYNIDMSHFTGNSWNKGMRGYYRPLIPLKDILVRKSTFQSFKLKIKLFREGLKSPMCEDCGHVKSFNDDTEIIFG